MKRLFLLLLLVVLPAHATITKVSCSGTCNANASGNSLSSSSLNFTAGHFLAVAIRAGSTVTINTPTDSPQNNTWNCGAAADSGSGTRVVFCYAFNIVGGNSDVITVTTSASSNIHMYVSEYAGVATSCNPVYGQVTGTTSSGTSVTTSASVTTASADGLIAVAGSGTNVTFTAGSGYIERATSGNPPRAGLEDQLTAGAGSFNASITTSISTDIVIALNGILGSNASCAGAAHNMPPVVLTIIPNTSWLMQRIF